MQFKSYFYQLIRKYLALYVLPQNSLVWMEMQREEPISKEVGLSLTKNCTYVGVQPEAIKPIHSQWSQEYIVLNGLVHYLKDIQNYIQTLKPQIREDSRVIILYYSQLWKPFFKLATFLGIREKTPEQNWVSHEDLQNFLLLSRYELLKRETKILMPIYIPLISSLVNRYMAPLPVFQWFGILNIAVARPIPSQARQKPPSVSVVIPARNEAGNIENAIQWLPQMGPDDEIIFVEGNSTDNTWQVIQEMYEKYRHVKNIHICQQPGRGKGDAVRKGFSVSSKEIFMILDADLTVHPTELPKFYNAVKDGVCEFANGSRLVYPMEKKAMRFFNMIGNKFFAAAFTFVLGQAFKDTLCGTKVLTKENYEKIMTNRSYFGDFDPFGDFDLLFGASRLCLKIADVPVSYKERVYGETNIQRWRHGAILLRMLMFAARRIRFI